MTTTESITESRAELSPAADAPSWETQCLNCHAPLAGPFCAQCGQRAVPPHPSVREIAGEAIAELTGWDGKFIETFRLLLTRPGAVTRQFIEGKRVRFISPVRLYLTMSVIYFLIAAAAPNLDSEVLSSTGGVKVQVTSGPETAGRAVESAKRGTLSPALRDSALKQVARAPRIIKPILQRLIEDPQGFKRNVLETMPRVLFVLLPIFALILDVFYRRFRYPAHLYFSIHFHTLVFMVLAVAEVSKFSHNVYVAGTVRVTTELLIIAYGVIALRGMYGGSIPKTIAKGLGVGLLYSAISSCSLFALSYYAATH